MTFDFEQLSAEFKEFHTAFSPASYGHSMGRAADHAAYMYDDFTDAEKALATDWFLELFAQRDNTYFGHQYFWVIEKMDDLRFIPLLKKYLKYLKLRHKQPVRSELNGEMITVRPSFRTDIKICRKTIRKLKWKF